jgi:2-haloacid dehalogenase
MMKAKTNSNQPSRRDFIKMSAIGLAAIQTQNTSLFNTPKIKAIMFDAFVIFNPKPISLLAEKLFPNKGNDLIALWRSKQFEYCWIRTAGTHYKNFWTVTQDALKYSAKKNGIELNVTDTSQLMDAYLKMELWPDVADGLKKLKRQGIRLFFLSNLTAEMLNANIKHNHLEGYFDNVLSTDPVSLFKPSPTAYDMGIKASHFNKDEILFAAFAAWDVVGAKWFGYPTYWVNRGNTLPEELDVKPDATGNNLADVLGFINA